MADDRFFYYLGLIDAATKNEVPEVNKKEYNAYYLSVKICEISLSKPTGRNYKSLFYLIDEVS